MLKFTAEGAVEEGGEKVLGLAQRLPLHRTQTLDSLNQGRKFLLEGERGKREVHLCKPTRPKVGHTGGFRAEFRKFARMQIPEE